MANPNPYGGGYQQPPGAGGYGAPQGQYGAPGGYPGQAPGGYGQPGGYPGQPGPAAFGGPPGCPPNIRPEIWQWFTSIDTDASHKLTVLELQQALTNSNWSHFNAETCRLMIGMFDRDRSGTIELSEFQQLWDYILQWKGVFDRYDRDRSGFIEHQELSQAWTEMGYRLSPQFYSLVIMKFDIESRRHLKFDQFIQASVMLKSLTDAFKARDRTMQGVIQVSYEDFMSMVMSNSP